MKRNPHQCRSATVLGRRNVLQSAASLIAATSAPLWAERPSHNRIKLTGSCSQIPTQWWRSQPRKSVDTLKVEFTPSRAFLTAPLRSRVVAIADYDTISVMHNGCAETFNRIDGSEIEQNAGTLSPS